MKSVLAVLVGLIAWISGKLQQMVSGKWPHTPIPGNGV